MRPQVVTVGSLATSSATKIGLSQKAAISGTNYFVLNGAAGSFSANSVAASQTPGGAVALTLAAGASNLPLGSRIYITGGSDESGKTFAVIGKRYGGVAGAGVVVTETITGPNASTVSSIQQYDAITSITSSAGTTGAITVGHYTTATLDVARRVIFTSGGNDTGVTIVLTGTDVSGLPISESITGASGAAASSVLDYKTITSATASAAVATVMTIGTNGVAASQWATFDPNTGTAPTSIQVNGTGTVNWTIQQTLDDPNSTSNATARASMNWVSHPDSALVGSTVITGVQGNYAYPPVWARILLNSGSGTVTATFIQAGMFS